MTPDWSKFNRLRKAIDARFEDEIVSKPERIPVYEDMVSGLRKNIQSYGIDTTNEDEMFVFISSLVFASHFILASVMGQCNDPHVHSHVKDAAVCLGYCIRDLCFACEAPSHLEAL